MFPVTDLVIGGVSVLLVCSALVTATGAAVLQLGPSRVRTLLDEGFRGADELAEIRGDEGRARMTLRLVTRALNLAAVGLATLASQVAWGNLMALAVLAGGIVSILVITDVLPRVVAGRH
ncbi:MAG TPA: CNNM domain-containing protein, partial [Longimicrobiales bacterium]|nr:CNNM domain-containing protein [Longimicrobiales bacterium]